MEFISGFIFGAILSLVVFWLLNKQQEQKIQNVLKPFDDKLEDYHDFISATHQTDIKERARMKEQIDHMLKSARSIEKETHQLSQALTSDVKFQGDWGEMVLERVLELSGLREGVEFELQKNFHFEGKNYRPDAVVMLPQNSHLIVDSKVSLRAYFDFLSSGEDRALKDLKQSIISHIDQLSGKNYQLIPDLNAPDFVYLFMPVEGVYAEVLRHFPEIIDQALKKNIILVSPVNLMASLKTVAALWRVDKQSKSAVEIAHKAGAMYDKLALLIDDIQKLKTHFKRVDQTFDDIEKRLHTGKGNLMDRAHDLKESGARTSKEISH